MKDMKRAIRRHQLTRIKSKRKTYWGGLFQFDPRQVGKLAQTATLCSCFMCGNQRKWYKGKSSSKTLKEVAFSKFCLIDHY